MNSATDVPTVPPKLSRHLLVLKTLRIWTLDPAVARVLACWSVNAYG
ncbi:hypothetical protein ACF9IK_01475 [Kitasatospora hibisci]